MKLRSKLSAIISRLCVMALALIGYSCNTDDSNDDILCMYGTPTGSFEIKGTVTDEKGDPVKEALIRMADPKVDSGIWSIASSVSNSLGHYEVNGRTFPNEDLKVVCIPMDKKYEPDSITVPVKYISDKDHQKDAWYEGHASVNVDFKLKQISGN